MDIVATTRGILLVLYRFGLMLAMLGGISVFRLDKWWTDMVLELRSVGGVVVAGVWLNGVWERVVASCPSSPKLVDDEPG